MNRNEKDFHRQAIRAALRIHEHVCGPARQVDPGSLPTDRWQEIERAHQRLRHCQQLGWTAASEAVARDLGHQLRYLVNALDAKRTALTTNGIQPASPPSAIAADLLALCGEFEEITIDLKHKLIRVDTAAIELEEVPLGQFQIVLYWERIGAGRAYEVRALQPNCPRGRSDITHPHVEDHYLCEGTGASAIRSALQSGRILDFCLLVRQTLETYNGNSPYVPLSDWDGGDSVSCEDCGYDMPLDDSCSCDRCDCSMCSDCTSTCPDCGRVTCSNCRDRCAGCGDSYCVGCLTNSSPQAPLVCESCLQEKESDSNEEGENKTLEADPVCVGEVAVPA